MALPPEIAGQLNLEGPPVSPRPAATVLVVNDARPWELLLVHRPGGADFAPGAYVFPGGTVHKDDERWDDVIRAAAVRELFEETGVLLAWKEGAPAGDEDCAAVRLALTEGPAIFAAALDGLGLVPAFEELVIFARWVTPAQLKRRYDTRFYLARMPAGQTILPREGEVTDWLWISPGRALESGDITLVYATRAVLESIADAPDADALFERARALREIPVVEPRVVRTEDGWEVVRDVP